MDRRIWDDKMRGLKVKLYGVLDQPLEGRLIKRASHSEAVFMRSSEGLYIIPLHNGRIIPSNVVLINNQ